MSERQERQRSDEPGKEGHIRNRAAIAVRALPDVSGSLRIGQSGIDRPSAAKMPVDCTFRNDFAAPPSGG